MMGTTTIAKQLFLSTVDLKPIVIIGTIIRISVYALCVRIVEPQLFVKFWQFIKLVFSKR